MSTLEYTLTAFDATGSRKELLWRPHISELLWKENHRPVDLSHLGFFYQTKQYGDWLVTTPETPVGKDKTALKKIKIQLGMKCNYACAYCSQAHQPHDNQGNPEDVKEFLEKIGGWFNGGSEGDGTGVHFELWGGEPFVYWKLLPALVGGIKTLYPKVTINMITNASMLTLEMIDWIDRNQISIGISHDGPGYEQQRGPDPLKDPAKLEMIKLLYERRRPFGGISFQVVLTAQNNSLAKARAYIAQKLDVPEYELIIGTEEILQPYDAGGMMLSPVTAKDHYDLRHQTFLEIVRGETSMISNINDKLTDCYRSIAFRRPWTAVGQKCGMDDKGQIAVTLKGDVMTCQNTSPDTYHKIGTVDEFDSIALNTSWHFTTRDECKNCPVVQLCQGACMYNKGAHWKQGCDNSFTYNVALLAVAIYSITKGMVLEKIDGQVIRRPELGTSVAVIDPVVALAQGRPR